MNTTINLALLAIPVATLSFTVTTSEITRSFRELLMTAKNPWFGKLFSCPFCFSHWAAGILVAFSATSILQFVLDTFTIVFFSTLWLWVLTRAYQTREHSAMRELRELLASQQAESRTNVE
jgi:hypothetical protein